MEKVQRIHDVKLDEIYWESVKTGNKRFEVRVNDRDYKEGDTISLHRFGFSLDPLGFPTKQYLNCFGEKASNSEAVDSLNFKITHVFHGSDDNGIKIGYVVIALSPNPCEVIRDDPKQLTLW